VVASAYGLTGGSGPDFGTIAPQRRLRRPSRRPVVGWYRNRCHLHWQPLRGVPPARTVPLTTLTRARMRRGRCAAGQAFERASMAAERLVRRQEAPARLDHRTGRERKRRAGPGLVS
jgi:hypothetical protein